MHGAERACRAERLPEGWPLRKRGSSCCKAHGRNGIELLTKDAERKERKQYATDYHNGKNSRNFRR